MNKCLCTCYGNYLLCPLGHRAFLGSEHLGALLSGNSALGSQLLVSLLESSLPGSLSSAPGSLCSSLGGHVPVSLGDRGSPIGLSSSSSSTESGSGSAASSGALGTDHLLSANGVTSADEQHVSVGCHSAIFSKSRCPLGTDSCSRYVASLNHCTMVAHLSSFASRAHFASFTLSSADFPDTLSSK